MLLPPPRRFAARDELEHQHVDAGEAQQQDLAAKREIPEIADRLADEHEAAADHGKAEAEPRPRKNLARQVRIGAVLRCKTEQAQIDDRDRADDQRQRNDVNRFDGRKGPFRLPDELRELRALQPLQQGHDGLHGGPPLCYSSRRRRSIIRRGYRRSTVRRQRSRTTAGKRKSSAGLSEFGRSHCVSKASPAAAPMLERRAPTDWRAPAAASSTGTRDLATTAWAHQ